MKGIVFNLLGDIVTGQYGADTWDLLLEQAQAEGSYTSLGNYPDDELLRIVAAASAALGQTPQDVVRWFGRSALPVLAARYPQFFLHQNTRDFVLTLNTIIHPEVRKLYPAAQPPDFEFDASSPDVLVMLYRSRRRLCAFAEGLIEGAAAHFGETVHIAHAACLHRGDPHCRLELAFSKAAAAA
jgi:hypothetical protein